jgi:hypothetical protein
MHCLAAAGGGFIYFFIRGGLVQFVVRYSTGGALSLAISPLIFERLRSTSRAAKVRRGTTTYCEPCAQNSKMITE